MADATKAVQNSNANVPGGFLITPDREMLVRGIGRIESSFQGKGSANEQLQKSAIKAINGAPVLLEQVADVKIAPALRRGDGLFRGKRALILTVTKQPSADTPTVVKAIDAAMTELKAGLPPGITFLKTFDQNIFIQASISNVEEALRDGTIIVSAILIIFLMNWRTVLISLSALPLSLLLG